MTRMMATLFTLLESSLTSSFPKSKHRKRHNVAGVKSVTSSLCAVRGKWKSQSAHRRKYRMLCPSDQCWSPRKQCAHGSKSHSSNWMSVSLTPLAWLNRQALFQFKVGLPVQLWEWQQSKLELSLNILASFTGRKPTVAERRCSACRIDAGALIGNPDPD